MAQTTRKKCALFSCRRFCDNWLFLCRGFPTRCAENGMLLQCCWRGLSSALPGTRLGERTRAGRVPASYPTTSTRRLMCPTADARTGRKAYADCRRDCRNTGINIQRGLRKVNACALLPAFLCSVPRPRSLSLPKGRVGLYSLRSRRHSAALRVTIPNANARKINLLCRARSNIRPCQKI